MLVCAARLFSRCWWLCVTDRALPYRRYLAKRGAVTADRARLLFRYFFFAPIIVC
jgi:hypothetical protein